MPSNNELIKSIAAVSAELEKDAPTTEGKNNNQLTSILSGLRTEKLEAPAAAEEAAAEEAAAEEAAAEEAAALAKQTVVIKIKKVEKPPFYVMPGKALTTKRGILSNGDGIKVEDLAGGADALTAFVKSGHVGES